MISHFVIIFIFLCFDFSFTTATTTCPIESWEFSDKCLFFNSTNTGFDDADLQCQSLGGHLVSIHDAFFNSILGQEASTYFSQSSLSDFWIGAKLNNGIGTWLDGTNFNYQDWKNGVIPTYSDCVSKTWIDGYWSAQNCSILKPFVCSVMADNFITTTHQPPTSPTTPPTFPTSYNCSTPGWIYLQASGLCYGAFTSNLLNFTEAENRCKTFGAHLPSTHNHAEVNFLYRNHKSIIWLGLYSSDGGQTWQWTDSTPFDYGQWNSGFPIPNGGCGYLITYSEDGHDETYYENTGCNQTFNSICQKSYLTN